MFIIKNQGYDLIGVGLRIKKARERLNFTQDYISEQINVNPQHVSDIERGKVGISVGTLIKICDALSVTSDYVLFSEDATQKDNTFYHVLQQMSVKDQIFIESFIDLYIKRHQK